jgi:tetratricopeptide (TPR) repeat protein
MYHYNKGNFEAAINLYEQALMQDPGNYLAWELKGLAQRDLGKHEESLNSFDRVIAIDSVAINAWSDKGYNLCIMGRYQEAVVCFDRAIQIMTCASLLKIENRKLLWAIGEMQKHQMLSSKVQSGAKCID